MHIPWAVVLSLAMLSFSFQDCISSRIEETLSPLIVLGSRACVIVSINSVLMMLNSIPCVVRTTKIRCILFLRAVSGYTAFLLFLTSLSLIHVADAVVVFATTPFWTIVLGIILLKEKPPIVLLPAGVVCIIGVVLVVQPSFVGFKKSAHSESYALGFSCALGAAIGAGFAYITTRYLKDDVHYLAVTQYFALLCLPFSAIQYVLMDLPSPYLDVPLLGALALNGFFGYLGQLGVNRGMQTATSGALASMVTFLECPLASLWSAFAMRQFPGALQVLGMLLIGITVAALAIGKECTGQYAKLSESEQIEDRMNLDNTSKIGVVDETLTVTGCASLPNCNDLQHPVDTPSIVLAPGEHGDNLHFAP